MSLIDARELTVSYGRHRVLDRINFSISEAEIVTVIGPNGSGKSSFIKAILGVMPIESGRIEIRTGLRIGYVPQKLLIDPSLPITVQRFLELSRHPDGANITDTMAQVGAPELGGRQVSDLSGGQFQRILLARALLGRPHLLVLDEPTQGLDQPGVASFYQLIEGLRQQFSCAVLLVSHDLHVVMSASDRVICLNGHVCCEGSPQVVSAAPQYRALFGAGTGGALALYRHDHDHDTCGHDHG